MPLRVKSLQQLVSTAENDHGLRRVLGPWSLISLGIGAIIGTGIFVLTGQAASMHAGPAIVISMIIAGIVSALAGICYAELASAVPVAGSAYTYASATLGEFVAWIIGWDLILEYALGAATVAVGWSGYVGSLLRDAGLSIPAAISAAPGTVLTFADGSTITAVFNLPAVLIATFVTWLLVRGVQESARVNAVMVAIKVAVVLVVIVAGAPFVRAENYVPFVPENTGNFGAFGWSGIFRGAAVIFFAYIGFDAVSTAAQEAKNPQRDVPRGILGSLVLCTLLYVMFAAVLTGVVNYKELNVAAPVAIAVDRMGMPFMGQLMKLGAIAGLTSVMLVMLYSQARIFWIMSTDGLLPRVFSKLHPRFRTPWLSSALTGVAVAIAGGVFPIGTLGDMVSIGTLFAFVLVCAGVLVLRRTKPDLPRPFRTPFVPVVPILGMLCCLGLMSGLGLHTWERLFIWLAIGLVIYFAWGRFHSNARTGAARA